jgi:hypothetical protein
VGEDANVEARRIVAWDATTRIAQISPPFAVIPTGIAELLATTSDNAYPYTNTRSVTLPHKTWSLVSLTIPRSLGNEIANYPYVYMSVGNPSAVQTNTLASNNPGSVLATFIATLTSNNNSASFYKLSGDACLHQLQINPHDSLYIRLLLPDGTTWRQAQADPPALGPQAPNPLAQISLVLSYE